MRFVSIVGDHAAYLVPIEHPEAWTTAEDDAPEGVDVAVHPDRDAAQAEAESSGQDVEAIETLDLAIEADLERLRDLIGR